MARYFSETDQYYKVVNSATNKVLSSGILTAGNEINTIFTVTFITEKEYTELDQGRNPILGEYKPMPTDYLEDNSAQAI